MAEQTSYSVAIVENTINMMNMITKEKTKMVDILAVIIAVSMAVLFVIVAVTVFYLLQEFKEVKD